MAREIFKEHYKSFEKDIAAAARQKDFIPGLLDKLKAISGRYQQVMKDCGKEALKIADTYGLEVGDFSNGAGGVMGYLSKITYKDDFDPKVRARKALLAPENWHTKTSKKKEFILTAVSNGLADCLTRAVDNFDQNHQQYESARQVMRYLYTFGILANITQKLEEYRDENELLLISDAAVFLKEIIGDNEVPFIYEKIGTTFKHYLIDEFQDTSGFQWENFKPLIKNSLAEGNTNLVVGDVKQSIYRWRGGDWELLLNKIKQDVGEAQTEELNLNENWRSSKHIIDFNNNLFAGTPSVLETLGQKDLLEIENETVQQFLKQEVSKISAAYKDVIQELPFSKVDKEKKGFVRFSFLQGSHMEDGEQEEEDAIQELGWKEEVLKKIPGMVESFQDEGYSLKDIAFLVRNKRDGKLIADRLLAYKSLPEAKKGYKYEVISSESLMLGSSVSVNMLLNTLRYLNNPSDVIARVNMVYDYQIYVCKNETINLHQLYTEASENTVLNSWLPPSFHNMEEVFTGYPLFEIIENLIRVFNLQDLKGEYAYLQTFQDIVLDYGRKESADIPSFLKWWGEQGDNQAVQVSENTDAIKVLTIHKSKGLQFKVVVIPFCDWKIDHDPLQDNMLWCCTDFPPFNEIPYLPLKYSGSLKATIYNQHFYQEMVKAYLDSLNLLYVAFTRAENCLIAFGELPTIKKDGEVNIKRVSDLLFQYFNVEIQQNPIDSGTKVQSLKEYWDPENNIFEMGRLEKEVSINKSEDNIISLKHYPSLSWRSRLSIKPRAKNFFMETEGLVVKKINYGLLIHNILAEIKDKNELEGVLERFNFDGIITKEEMEVLEKKIKEILNHPQIARWFQPGWEVKTEVPILPLSGRINRLDRVMIKGNKAVVVDFKSGAIDSSHKNQVRHYSKLLLEMGYSHVEGHIVYLDPVEIITVD